MQTTTEETSRFYTSYESTLLTIPDCELLAKILVSIDFFSQKEAEGINPNSFFSQMLKKTIDLPNPEESSPIIEFGGKPGFKHWEYTKWVNREDGRPSSFYVGHRTRSLTISLSSGTSPYTSPPYHIPYQKISIFVFPPMNMSFTHELLKTHAEKYSHWQLDVH